MDSKLDDMGITARPIRDKGPGDALFEQRGYKHVDTETVEPRKVHEYDKPEIVALHADLRGHYAREIEKQAEWRREMAKDEDIYDSAQWDDEDKAILEERGQVPLVFNVIATSVNWILGSQRRSPTDYKILPRQKAGLAHAEKKSQYLKFLSDVNDTPMSVTRAFGETVKAGLSWLEAGVQEDDDGEPIYDRFESWRNIIFDSSAEEMDFSDGRYCFRARWVDEDRACAMFEDRAGLIRTSSESIYDGSTYRDFTTGDDAMDSREAANQTAFFGYGTVASPARNRVRLYEAWFKKPVKAQFLKGGEFSGELYDRRSKGHARSLKNPRVQVVEKVKERMYVAIFCDKGMLWLSRSPYRHNLFPFTPIWGYRRARDGAPYGAIRNARDIQIDLNKRAAKALWHLTAKRAMVQQGAVKDIEQFREEMARPDAILVYEAGMPPPQIDTDIQHANAQAEFMARDIAMIEQTSGVTNENMGRETNAASGKAIIARQDQGELTTNIFFENLRFARKKHGEKMLSLIEQFATEERQFRITNARGNPEYVTLNAEGDDDSSITETKADFVVAEVDYRATHRQQNLQSLVELASMVSSTNPALIMGIFDLLVEAMDIPKQEEIVKRIRQATGMTDPDADPANPSPEDQAILAEKKAKAEMQQRAAEAEIAGAEAKARETEARAKKIEADITGAKSAAEQAELDKFAKAIETAINVAGLDAVALAAETLLASAKQAADQLYPETTPPPAAPGGPMPMPAMAM